MLRLRTCLNAVHVQKVLCSIGSTYFAAHAAQQPLSGVTLSNIQGLSTKERQQLEDWCRTSNTALCVDPPIAPPPVDPSLALSFYGLTPSTTPVAQIIEFTLTWHCQQGPWSCCLFPQNLIADTGRHHHLMMPVMTMTHSATPLQTPVGSQSLPQSLPPVATGIVQWCHLHVCVEH